MNVDDILGEDSDDQDSDEDVDNDEDDGVLSNVDEETSQMEFLNVSVQGESPSDTMLRYIEFYGEQTSRPRRDIIDVIDRNERNFKQIAEKMIDQTS